MDELLEQFVVEGRELVQQASDDLLALERAPHDRALLDRLFRSVHTLKGSAAIFALAPMVGVLHAAEDRLDAARRDGAALTPIVIDAVLDVIGRCDEWIAAVAASGGGLPPGAETDASRLLAALAGMERAEGAAPAAGPPAWAAAFRDGAAAVLAAIGEGADVTLLRYAPASDCFFLGDDPLGLLRDVPGLLALHLAVAPAHDGYDPFRCSLVATAASTASLAELRSSFRFHADQVELVSLAAEGTATSEDEVQRGSVPATDARAGSLRVAAARLDELIEGLGELLAAKNAAATLLRRCADLDPSLAGPVAEASSLLDRQVNEAYHRALRLRLVPLARVFVRLPRLVRETAAALGKGVDLAVVGGEIEIDRAVADALFEPLLHLLRNAVDHGIEAADRRRAAGKPETGGVRLAAERVAQGIVITVADDGGGIVPARVRDAAVGRSVIDAAEAATLDLAGTLELLFRPGFSTAGEVSGISGRGVGLDAVRAGVEAIGGTVTLDSEEGRGSTFRLVLPQRAAITAVMLVRAGGGRWGVPADAVSEVFRLRPEAITAVQDGRALVHRGRTVAVLDLADVVGAPRESDGMDDGRRILMTRIGDEDVALVVADIEGREDVLLRPCDGLLAASRLLQGTAVLGDGDVLMVLDLAALRSAGRDARRYDS